MITCKDIPQLANMHVDGELPEELQIQIERHLLQCQGCAFEVRSIEQTKSMLAESFPRQESPASYRERALARLQAGLSDVLSPPLEPADTQWALPFLRDQSS